MDDHSIHIWVIINEEPLYEFMQYAINVLIILISLFGLHRVCVFGQASVNQSIVDVDTNDTEPILYIYISNNNILAVIIKIDMSLNHMQCNE